MQIQLHRMAIGVLLGSLVFLSNAQFLHAQSSEVSASAQSVVTLDVTGMT